VLVGVKVEVEGLLPFGGGPDAFTTPLFPLQVHPAACAVCCRGLCLAVVLQHSGGGAGTAPYVCLTPTPPSRPPLELASWLYV
jgi:hypothetical protein